jgi:hypothetical protein
MSGRGAGLLPAERESHGHGYERHGSQTVANEDERPCKRASSPSAPEATSGHPGRTAPLRGSAATTGFVRGFPCGIRAG